MDSESVMATAQEKNNLHFPQWTKKKRVYSKEEGEEQKKLAAPEKNVTSLISSAMHCQA